MTLIDTIKQMMSQGMSDANIVQQLREQGYNANEINDALNQSKIKSAVYEESEQQAMMNNQQMQPSVMTQEISNQVIQPEYPQYQQAPQEYYQPSYQTVSTEMMTEIAEQIVSEKLNEIKKGISGIVDFKAIIEAKVAGIDERLRRIETTIDKLQLAILGKIGGNLQEIQDIKSELGMMQESFSKVINPLVDRQRENQPETEVEQEQAEQEQTEQEQAKQTKQTKQRKTKNKPDFEDFLTR